MKTKTKTKSMFMVAVGIIAIGIYFSGCKKSEESSPSGSGNADESMAKSQNAYIFPKSASMYGKTYAQWGAEWWRWIFSFDCAHLPLVDHTGALQNQNQSGPVFFLGGSGGTVETRAVTVPADKAILFPLVNYYANYPCGSSQPTAGETVEHFLSAQVEDVLPLMDQLSLSIDGNSIGNLADYLSSPYVFNYTGNANLATCY